MQSRSGNPEHIVCPFRAVQYEAKDSDVLVSFAMWRQQQ